ncbi:hypothetical protein D3C86_1974980 [compost metagenome]
MLLGKIQFEQLLTRDERKRAKEQIELVQLVGLFFQRNELQFPVALETVGELHFLDLVAKSDLLAGMDAV